MYMFRECAAWCVGAGLLVLMGSVLPVNADHVINDGSLQDCPVRTVGIMFADTQHPFASDTTVRGRCFLISLFHATRRLCWAELQVHGDVAVVATGANPPGVAVGSLLHHAPRSVVLHGHVEALCEVIGDGDSRPPVSVGAFLGGMSSQPVEHLAYWSP